MRSGSKKRKQARARRAENPTHRVRAEERKTLVESVRRFERSGLLRPRRYATVSFTKSVNVSAEDMRTFRKAATDFALSEIVARDCQIECTLHPSLSTEPSAVAAVATKLFRQFLQELWDTKHWTTTLQMSLPAKDGWTQQIQTTLNL